jgi:hypothetical protein
MRWPFIAAVVLLALSMLMRRLQSSVDAPDAM